MPEKAAAELYELMCEDGLEIWLDGGWGVDALLAEQTRPHRDLDVFVREEDLSKLRNLMRGAGFSVERDAAPSNVVFEDGGGSKVDVHTVRFDSGVGVHRMEDGGEWVFPEESFDGLGSVGGSSVRCLSPEAQVSCHAQGYTPSEKDLRDMELLHRRFGVELPPTLRRSR